MPAENGTIINPTPVTDNVTDVVVAPIATSVSIDSNIGDSFLKIFLSLFQFMIFIFKVGNHLFNVVI